MLSAKLGEKSSEGERRGERISSLDGFTFVKINDVSTPSPPLTDIAGINSFILQLASERCWLGHSTAPHRPARIDIIAGRSQYQQVHMADRIQNVLK